MPLSQNFSSSESLSTLSNVTFLDTSTGQDLGLTERRIYCRIANGNWLLEGGVESTTEAYITWPIADVSITIDLLIQSTTSSVKVNWMTGSSVTYTKTTLTIWDLYDYVFAFGLIQSQTATPNIISDTNYYNNFFQFITNLWSAESAVTYGNDLYSSNSALVKNQWLINNANLFY